ncbi:mucin-binding protein, partial [Limosilactobacillus sp.]|uniref:mucin-binding protein n=1 Tax=Limosilactobacillus sp. TaxID=2773925 RepID=UPI003F0CBD83
MKLSRYQYCSSLIGLLSATVLLSLSSGNVLADENTNPPSSHLAVSDHVDEQINTKEVTRTINYVDPLTNEKHTIKQVAHFQFNHDGKLIKGATPIWQAYFAPYFEGYHPNLQEVLPKLVTPKSADEVENIIYNKGPKKDSMRAIVKFISIDGSTLPKESRLLTIQNTDGKPLTTFELPAPPQGWEYVSKDQLPSTLRCTSNSILFMFLVQRSNPASHREQKELSRKIILHLPTGDQVITQRAHAIRDVSTIDGQEHYGEWQISPFEELALPLVDGYDSSLAKIGSLQLAADQIDKELPTIEVDYHKTTKKDSTAPSKDEGNQADPVPGISEGTQTDLPAINDEKTQTDPTPGQNEGTQTDQSTKTDEGSQTDDTSTVDIGVGDDTIDDNNQEAQKGPTPGKDEGNQTGESSTADTGAGDDSIGSSDQGTQTDPIPGKDEDTQTDQSAKIDEGSQTDDTSTVDTGVGDDTIDDSDQGTQTDPILGKDEDTQTDQSEKTDDGTQTKNTSTIDTGVGDDTVDASNHNTQTSQSAKTDEDSQTDDTSAVDTGVGDDTIAVSNQGTQTDPIPGKDEDTQT